MSRREWALAGLLAVAALVLGIVLHPLAIDDAFITYRYARNLLAGNGFTVESISSVEPGAYGSDPATTESPEYLVIAHRR